MKHITMTNIPDIEKGYDELKNYLRSMVWDFYTDGCLQIELLVGKDEPVLLEQIIFPLKEVLITEQLPVFMGLGNHRVVLYRV